MPLLLVDLDNTLVGRYAAFERWAFTFVERLGAPLQEVDWLIRGDADGYKPREEFATEIALRFGLLDPAASAVIEQLRDGMVAQLEIDQDVLLALEEAAQADWIPVAVTNGTQVQQERKIRHVGLEGYLASWVISDAVGVAKPDPQIFHVAAEQVGGSLDGAWMIGDSAHADIGGAHAVGIESVWLHRGRSWESPGTPQRLWPMVARKPSAWRWPRPPDYRHIRDEEVPLSAVSGSVANR